MFHARPVITHAMTPAIGDTVLAAPQGASLLTCRLLKCSSSKRSRKPTRLPHTWRWGHSSSESHAHGAGEAVEVAVPQEGQVKQ